LLVVPDVLLVLPVPLVPPSPSSGVLALEQPNAPEITRNPTDAMPAYALIMIASLFQLRDCFVHQVRRRPSP
jgi:hypothetical protein